MSVVKNGMSKARKSLALATVAGVAISMAAIAAPAQAASQNIDDVTLTWGLNLETGAGAYNGSCNFLSAGKAGNTGSSRTWTVEDGFYQASAGNVSIIKDGPNSSTIAPSWATKCQTGAGTNVSPNGTTAVSNNKVVLSEGTGTVDSATGAATISWTGSFTSVFYGGLTYWSATDPVLTVNADGTATLKATASGYGADQGDASVWNTLPATTVTLANLTGVEISDSGFVSVPEYKEVSVPLSVTNQVKTGANWGAFPTDFVEYQGLTGTQPYWYSSGGGADPRKVSTALNVGWSADFSEPEEPEVPGETTESKDVDVDVKVPEKVVEPEEPGVFKWTVGSGNANLGTATQNAAGFTANGSLPTITIDDARDVTGGWQLTGKASAFGAGSNTFAASALGWTPAGTGTTGVVTLGSGVVAGTGNGLSAAAVMASATGASEATLSTGIQLLAPASAAAGDYTSTLTITAIQK